MGTHLNRLVEAVLTITHNLVGIKNMKNIIFFNLKIFLYLVLKFSIYLNRHVFIIAVSRNYWMIGKQIDPNQMPCFAASDRVYLVYASLSQ